MDVLMKADPPAFKPDQSLSFTCTVGLSAAQVEAMRTYYRQQGVCAEHVEHFHLFDMVRIALEAARNSLVQLMDSGELPDLDSPLHMDGRQAPDETQPRAGTAPGFRVSLQLPDGFHRAQ